MNTTKNLTVFEARRALAVYRPAAQAAAGIASAEDAMDHEKARAFYAANIARLEELLAGPATDKARLVLTQKLAEQRIFESETRRQIEAEARLARNGLDTLSGVLHALDAGRIFVEYDGCHKFYLGEVVPREDWQIIRTSADFWNAWRESCELGFLSAGPAYAYADIIPQDF